MTGEDRAHGILRNSPPATLSTEQAIKIMKLLKRLSKKVGSRTYQISEKSWLKNVFVGTSCLLMNKRKSFQLLFKCHPWTIPTGSSSTMAIIRWWMLVECGLKDRGFRFVRLFREPLRGRPTSTIKNGLFIDCSGFIYSSDHLDDRSVRAARTSLHNIRLFGRFQNPDGPSVIRTFRQRIDRANPRLASGV